MEEVKEKVKIMSLVNIKGGVGKTISTVNIAACLQEKGYSVLVIDLDAQANTSQFFKVYDEEKLSVSSLLLDIDGIADINPIIMETEYEGLDIIPANLSLAVCEKELLIDSKRKQQDLLKQALKKVQNDYDFCIIDCPPKYLSMLTINALVASNEVLVPIQIDDFSIKGLGNLMENINEIKDKYNDSLKFRGCFITMDSPTKLNKDMKKILKENLKDKMFNTSIRTTVKVRESIFAHIPVVFYDEKANASIDYRNFVNELLEAEDE